MWKKIRNIIKTKTFQHTGIVTAGTILNGILGFLFFWILAHLFSPENFGVFNVAIVAGGLLTDIASIGTDTGIVNFVGRHIVSNKEKALKFLKLALETKVIVSIIVLSIGWFLTPYAAEILLKQNNLSGPLKFSLFIAVSGLLFSFAMSSLQSIQKFTNWSVINIFANAVRLIAIYLLFTSGILTITSGLTTYILVPFLAFLISLLFLPNFFKVKNESSVASEFFHYNKWVAIFTLIAAASSRMDLFLVTRISGLSSAGIYSVALTLSGVVPQLVGAIGTVVAPKLASIKNKKSTIIYVKKLQIFVGVLALLGVISGTVVGYFFIHKFYSISYISSFVPFVILLIAQSIFLFSVPVHMAVIYHFSYPKLFLTISVINILIIGVGGYMLISYIGIVGAAIAVLIGNISNFLIPAYWVAKKFKEK